MYKLIRKNRQIAKIRPAALTPEIAIDLENRGFIIVGYSRPRLISVTVTGARNHG